MQFSKKELQSNSSDLNLYPSSANQSHKFLLGEYKLDNLKCGSKYELYMTATNSMGTGEASERIFGKYIIFSSFFLKIINISKFINFINI